MNNTVTIKIGTFPGRLNDYALEEGTTVREALNMAGITLGDEQEVKLDGEVANMDSVIKSGAGMLLVTKRLKGATTL